MLRNLSLTALVISRLETKRSHENKSVITDITSGCHYDNSQWQPVVSSVMTKLTSWSWWLLILQCMVRLFTDQYRCLWKVILQWQVMPFYVSMSLVNPHLDDTRGKVTRLNWQELSKRQQRTSWNDIRTTIGNCLVGHQTTWSSGSIYL